MKKLKLGFIGCGNMAGAIMKGLSSLPQGHGASVYAFDISAKALKNAAEQYNVTCVDSVSQLVETCDAVILAVKPNIIASVLTENKKVFAASKPLVISIAAGKTIPFLEEHLNLDGCKIIRVMPNINAKVGEAMCGFCTNKNVTTEDENTVKAIFSGVGLVMKLDEKMFPVFSVIAGCAPAFAYMFIDALARAGVKNGMRKQEALEIAAQTVLGSAKMILESGEHPWALIDQVCSPGGTTIEGVTSLQADGMEAAVHNAVNKAVEKDKIL